MPTRKDLPVPHGASAAELLQQLGFGSLPVFDRSKLDAVCCFDGTVDQDILVELVGLFRSDSPQRIQHMREALAARSPEMMRHASHSLKGSASTLGGERLAAICYELERRSRVGSLDGAEGLVELAGSGVEALAQALFQYQKSGPAA